LRDPANLELVQIVASQFDPMRAIRFWGAWISPMVDGEERSSNKQKVK
jgi:hypothetical protein